MFIQYMLRICVVLHISSSFHKCAECVLVIKPQDVDAFSGEVVTLNCASSASKRGNIAWITKDPETFIYANNITAQSVLTYITVDDRDDGSCNLNITASAAAAKIYFCKELNSEAEAGAELVVIENNAKCTREIRDGSHIVNCSVVSAGKWAPTVVCEQLIEDGKLSGLQGIQTINTDNNVITSYWSFTSKKDDSCNMISCSIALQATGRPKTRIDPDCALCDFRDNGLRLRKRVLNSDDNYFWTLASRCFPTEFRDLLRGFDDASVILQKISCSISVIALIVTLLIYVCTWKLSGSTYSFFNPMLCIALSCAYIIFMAGILDSKGNCKAVVICLHYFLLVASSILLTEGVDFLLYMYVTIKKRRKLVTLLLQVVALVASVIVILPLALTKVEEIDPGLVCWLSVDHSFIWSFFGPVLIVFVANVVFVVVVLEMVFTRTKKSDHRKTDIKIREIRSALWNMSVTCPLLILGSLFYFLYSLYGSVLFLHLFVFATSLQGPLIFIFHGILNNKKVNSKLHCGSLLYKKTEETTVVKGTNTTEVPTESKDTNDDIELAAIDSDSTPASSTEMKMIAPQVI